MAVDFSVVLECDPRRAFGNGDCNAGTLDILERLKDKNRAEAIYEIAKQKGVDPETIGLTYRHFYGGPAPAEKELKLAELQAHAKPLEEYASFCDGCSANVLGQSYGCFGAINYPVPASAESWLLSRIQPPGTIGANLCHYYMAEHRITGESIRQMRRRGLFEIRSSSKIKLKSGFLRNISISADQFLETIFMSGNVLNPGHCMGILIWLGAIKVAGKVPGSSEDKTTIKKLVGLITREDKRRWAELEMGPNPDSEDAAVLVPLVKAMYLSWAHSVPMLISA